MTGRQPPPFGIADEWLHVRHVTVTVSREKWERWTDAARQDGYGPNGEDLSGWLRDLADERAAGVAENPPRKKCGKG